MLVADGLIQEISDKPLKPGSARVSSAQLVMGSPRSVTAKTALNSGSSKHGNAARAWGASNWVAASTCSTPDSST